MTPADDLAPLDAPAAPPSIAPSPIDEHGVHIIDTLITERAPTLSKSPFWPLMKAVLYPTLGYEFCVEMCDTVFPMGGRELFQHVNDYLNLDLHIDGLENIPREGAFILTPNHPTLSDAMATFRTLQPVRPDHMLMGLSDALRICPRLDEYIIPVEWAKDGKRAVGGSRRMLKAALQAFGSGRSVIIFPAGRMMYKLGGVYHERPWMPTAVSFHRRFKAPIVPMHITARNSWMFYFFNRFSTEMRDVSVFKEIVNKKDKPYKLVIGEPIQPDEIPGDDEEATRILQHFVTHDLPFGRTWAERTPPPAVAPRAVG